jgi:hypothetical protein
MCSLITKGIKLIDSLGLGKIAAQCRYACFASDRPGLPACSYQPLPLLQSCYSSLLQSPKFHQPSFAETLGADRVIFFARASGVAQKLTPSMNVILDKRRSHLRSIQRKIC